MSKNRKKDHEKTKLTLQKGKQNVKTNFQSEKAWIKPKGQFPIEIEAQIR